MRSSFQEENGSLLDDKDSAQDAASEEELTSKEVSASGGALGTSFHSENLRQHKNTTSLGTTALQEQGANKRKRKKPSARRASHNQLDKRSLEQKGQQPAATHLRSLEKTSIIKEIELAAEGQEESLSTIAKQELSLRILLTLSLRNGWQIATTRATTACSEDALGQQLKNIGLEMNKVDQNIFTGDELVIMLHTQSILIGGTDLQQELLFCELSALISLDQITKLDPATQVSFCNRALEYQEASHSISLSLPTSFYMELLQRHDLADAETIGSLEKEEPCQDAAEQNFALDAGRQELYRHTVGELVWAATACRPDLSFEVHLLTQSLTEPTTKQERQLHRVLRYLAGTLHYTLSLHTTNQMAKEKAKNIELLAFSASSWTETWKSTSTAYLILWGAPLIASCKTSCAHKQEDAELESVKLALALASHTRNFLQQLDMDQLGKDVHIGFRTSSFNEELVTGRPIAMQLGLSRRIKHLQLRGQLQLSKVHPDKNLAHSLTNNASGKRVLAKLRVNTGAAETVALSTVRGHSFASFVPSSSLVVGMVNLEPPKMESLQLRQLALSQSETCLESLSKNLADKSLASLTLPSLSLQRSNSESLTLHSLSFTRGNFESLSLQSLSLIAQNRFPRISFKELLFGTGSLKELEENLAHQLATRRAETNSFPQLSFPEDQLAAKEAKTNSFSNQSLSERILSLRMCLRIFWLSNFQLVCAALFLGYLVSMSFQSLIEQLGNKSFQTLSNQLCTSTLDSLIIQLDLVTSLSLPGFGSTRCKHHLQLTSFDKSSFEHRALPCAACF